MRLGDAQREFAYHVGCLLVHIAATPNAMCTLGDCYRDPRVHGKYGEKKSYSAAESDHKRRLAIDLNLFIHDQYRKDTAAHAPFGEYWKSLHPNNYWGGDIIDEHGNADGNHFGRWFPNGE